MLYNADSWKKQRYGSSLYVIVDMLVFGKQPPRKCLGQKWTKIIVLDYGCWVVQCSEQYGLWLILAVLIKRG